MRMARIKTKIKSQKSVKNVSEAVEKLELFYTAGGNAKLFRPHGKHCGDSPVG